MTNAASDDKGPSASGAVHPRFAASASRGPASMSAAARGTPVPLPPASDGIELSQLFVSVRHNFAFIIAVGLGVFLLVMAVTLTSPMEFRSSSRLYLGELDTKTRAASASSNDIELSAGSEGEVGSEIEIIKSRSLVSEAILKSGLNATITPALHAPPRYWRWLLSGRDPELLDTGLRDVRAIDASLPERFRERRTFSVRFSNETEYEVRSGASLLGVGRLGEPLKTKEVDLTLMIVGGMKPKSGARYDVVVEPIDQVVERVATDLQIAAPKAAGPAGQVNVLTLDFSARSPRLAAAFLDRLMLAYLKERQAWKTEDATAAEAFVATQLHSMRSSLDDVQRKLADYRTKHRVVVLDNDARGTIEQIAKYEEQRIAARLQVAALTDISKSLKGDNPPIGAYLFGEANDTVLEGMLTSLTLARQKLTDLEARFSAAAPDVKEQRAQVDAQLEQIRNYVASRLGRAQENLVALNGVVGQFEARLKTVPTAELGLAQLSRESEVYSRTYSYLLERQQQAAIVKASRLSKNRILDAPQVPLRESSPRLALRLGSLAGGLLLGVALVMSRALFGGRVQSELDTQRVAEGRPILAVIPKRSGRKPVSTSSVLDAAATTDDSRFIEAFRSLRAMLYGSFSPATAEGKVIVITSPVPGDGKTTCTWWLASVLAADGKRVLSIDADLRRPTAEPDSDDPHEQGLRGVLLGECSWRDAADQVSLTNHFALAAGGLARPETLAGERMARFLKEARASFDFVLIDSPSFPHVSDALAIAAGADAALSIVRLHHSPRKQTLDHVQRLSAMVPAYGVVVNDAGPSPRNRRAGPIRRDRNWNAPDRLRRSNRPRRWWLAAVLG